MCDYRARYERVAIETAIGAIMRSNNIGQYEKQEVVTRLEAIVKTLKTS